MVRGVLATKKLNPFFLFFSP
uniref:Uncharacterized protein n=1 Tax=Rhizophora mucronata TaxID=61149 RepID=A0A2P2PTQ3_RHIMU